MVLLALLLATFSIWNINSQGEIVQQADLHGEENGNNEGTPTPDPTPTATPSKSNRVPVGIGVSCAIFVCVCIVGATLWLKRHQDNETEDNVRMGLVDNDRLAHLG